MARYQELILVLAVGALVGASLSAGHRQGSRLADQDGYLEDASLQRQHHRQHHPMRRAGPHRRLPEQRKLSAYCQQYKKHRSGPLDGLGQRSINGSRSHGRIAGGKTDEGLFGSFVSLSMEKWGKQSFCGGVIVGQNIVLTAAQCLKDMESVTVGITANNPENWGDAPQIKARKMCPSSNYDNYNGKHLWDFGIVILEENIQFTDQVSLACLANHSPPEDLQLYAVGNGQYTNSVGWTFWKSKYPSENQYLPVHATKCKYEDEGPIHLCTTSVGKDPPGVTCNGDAGGPIFGMYNGQLTVFGIISYDTGSCNNDVNYMVSADVGTNIEHIDKLALECHQKTRSQ